MTQSKLDCSREGNSGRPETPFLASFHALEAKRHYNFRRESGCCDTKLWSVLATRKFGTTCPICKRFCFLGYVELDEKASVGDLRAKLLHDGWKGEVAKCDHLKCDGEVFCSWNAAVFLR